MFCQKCGKEVKEGTFCDNCGNRLDMPSVICYCSNCGAAVEDGRETCGECGAKIEGIFKLDVGSYSRGRGISSTDNTIKRSRKPKKAIVAVSIAAAVVIAAAAAFYFSGVFKGSISGSPVAANAYHKGAALNILTKSFHSDSAGADSPVVKELEKIAGTPLKLDFVADENYHSALTGIIGSGKYPHVLLINATNLAFLQAVRTGDFWDITDIFKDSAKYPNLSQANADVNHNISIDGKIYGIYRSRTIGRAGISVRKDWLDRLGMTTPETVEEFSQMLRRFTEDDPDGNGVKDTFGMIVTDYIDGPLDNLAVWCGAPNGWGEANGELLPSFMFDEYTDALSLMRDWYKNGYINSDMATYSSSKWNDRFVSGEAGAIIDVADRARRLAANIAPENPNAVVDVFGYVKKDAKTPAVTLPTSGYDGYYAFPKSTITTREDLEYVLGIMDRLNSEEAVNLMNYGIEGVHYTKDAENYVTVSPDESLKSDYTDLNQLSMAVVDFPNGLKTKYATPIAEKVNKVYEDNEKYALYNPAEPYLSEARSGKSAQLDAIIADAKVNYITGKISKEEYLAEIEKWKSSGGNELIKEINNLYKQSK